MFQSYGSFPGCEQGEPSFYELAQLPTPEPKNAKEYQEFIDAINKAEPATPHSSEEEYEMVDSLESRQPRIRPMIVYRAPSRINGLLSLIPPWTSTWTRLPDLDAKALEPMPTTTRPEEKQLETSQSLNSDIQNNMNSQTETPALSQTTRSDISEVCKSFVPTADPKTLRCEFCYAGFSGRNGMIMHLMSSHLDTNIDYSRPIDELIEELPLEIVKMTISQLNGYISTRKIPPEQNEFTRRILS